MTGCGINDQISQLKLETRFGVKYSRSHYFIFELTSYGTFTLTFIFLIFLISAISRRQVTISKVWANFTRAIFLGILL